jgi:uncharacterized protein (TIGR02099 family)
VSALAAALHRFWRGVWLTVAGLIVAAAVVMSLARVLVPNLEGLRGPVQGWVSAALRAPVTIGTLRAHWRGLSPVLTLGEVHLLDPLDGQTRLRFAHARIVLDPFASLRRMRPLPRRMELDGVRVTLLRRADGRLEWMERGGGDPLSWLSAHPSVRVRNAELVIRDEAGGEPLRLTGVHLSLAGGDRHPRLAAHLTLPADLGGDLDLVLDAQPMAAEGRNGAGRWRIRLYAVGQELRPAALLRLVDPSLEGVPGFDAAEADLGLWATLQGGRLTRLAGRLGRLDLPLGRGEGLRLAADAFAWQRGAAGWRFAARDLSVEGGDGVWRAQRLHLAAGPAEGGEGIGYRLVSDRLRVQDLAALASVLPGVPQGVRTAMGALEPAAELTDLRLDYGPVDGRLTLRTHFSGLALDPWGGSPQVRGLSGWIDLDTGEGRLGFAADSGSVAFPAAFREPWPVQRLAGRLRFERAAAGWRGSLDDFWFANADLAFKAAGRLDWPAAGSLFVDLQLGIARADVEGVPRYLPARRIAHRAVTWLDRGLVSGRVIGGKGVLRGRLADFPFTDGSGRFEIGVEVEDAIVDYAPGWPRLEEVAATVTFSQDDLSIVAESGKVLGADLVSARVAIDGLGRKDNVLTVRGAADVPVPDLRRFIRASPLRERFALYVDHLNGRGATRLDLSLEVPLRRGRRPRVRGALEFEDTHLEWPRLRLTLDAVRGTLAFTDASLEARGVTARFMGEPVGVALEVVESDDGPLTRVTLAGRAAPPFLEGRLHLPLARRVSGETAWRALLEVPPAGAGGAQPQLRVESDLHGLAIDLPYPLGKTADQRIPLVLRMPARHVPRRPVWLAYGERLSAALELTEGPSPVNRGELRLGSGLATLPSARGLYVRGSLPRLSLDAWLQALREVGDEAAQGPGDWPRASAVLEGLRAIRVDTGRLTAMGQDLAELELTAANVGGAWSVQVQSSALEGRLYVPSLGSNAPVRVDLERLYLDGATDHALRRPSAVDDGEWAGLDPARLPDLEVRIGDVRYGDMALGRFVLSATHRTRGLSLDRVALESEVLDVEATGQWLVEGGEQLSSFDIHLDSPDLGDALSALGFVGAVEGGRSAATVHATWPGPPTAFALKRLSGRLDLRVGEGRLLQVDPGAGRVFGLLSMQSLTRRLSLDFSDLFTKGLTFDRIEGGFTLDGGDAYTNTFMLEGPAARIDVVGRIGLAARDYDQRVGVTPSVSGSLGVAGALAMSNVGAGAALLLAQKILEPKLDRMARIEYRVTGAWDQPLIERLDLGGDAAGGGAGDALPGRAGSP